MERKDAIGVAERGMNEPSTTGRSFDREKQNQNQQLIEKLSRGDVCRCAVCW